MLKKLVSVSKLLFYHVELFTQVTDVAIYTIGAVSSGTPNLTSLVEVQVFHLICAILLLFYFDWD